MDAAKQGHRFKHGESPRRGMPATREYWAWDGAKKRCYTKGVRSYRYYGARGITMCDEWRADYLVFLRDMGRCPPGMSLDRIDVNGNYEPSNCRWATASQQQLNRRDRITGKCKRGHDYSVTMVIAKGGFRLCRECKRQDSEKYHAAVRLRAQASA